MKLINSLALALFLTSAEAFGPAAPVSGAAFGVSSSVSGNNDMTMRVSLRDMGRRQKFNNILHDIGGKSTKEAVEQQLLSPESAQMLVTANWKLRKVMIRKIRKQASKFDIDVDPSFGLPPTQEGREAAEVIAGVERSIAKVAQDKSLAEEAANILEARTQKKAAKKAKYEARDAERKAARPAKAEKAAEPVAAPEPVVAEAAAPEPVAEEAPEPAAATGGEITPKTIKQLRDLTGAGMMDCKKALIECDGDQVVAADSLRKRGLAQADKKASRIAAEGKIVATVKDNKAVMVEVNCETDFVAKDGSFIEFCSKVAGAAIDIEGNSIETLMTQEVAGESLESARSAMVSKIGENIQVRRSESRGDGKTTVGAYVHMNRIGVLVEIEGGTESLCTDIAMHVAAMNPPFATADQVPSDVLDKERKLLTEQALESGKPAEIVEKMVEGRIRKYLEEICLVSQNYVKDSGKTVGKLLEESDAKMIGFSRIAVGEGIEKKVDDFAAEVAAMAGQSA